MSNHDWTDQRERKMKTEGKQQPQPEGEDRRWSELSELTEQG
jgi:hypothetical protein